MSTLNEASGNVPERAGSMGSMQLFVVTALYLAGLLLSGVLQAYDSRPAVAVCLTALNVVIAWGLLWGGLSLARVPPSLRLASVLWTPLVWDTLLLSQLPYLGFFFVPVEALGAALLLRKRAALSWGASLLLGVSVRLLSIALTYAARPAVKLLFPWPG